MLTVTCLATFDISCGILNSSTLTIRLECCPLSVNTHRPRDVRNNRYIFLKNLCQLKLVIKYLYDVMHVSTLFLVSDQNGDG